MKDSEGLSERERELKDLKEQLRDTAPMGQLVGKCCTLDQVLTCSTPFWLYNSVPFNLYNWTETDSSLVNYGRRLQ